MDTFVVPFEIMKPNCAAVGNSENRSLIRDPGADARKDKTKGHAIVISAKFDPEFCSGDIVPQRDPRTVTDIDGSRMYPAGKVILFHAVPFDSQDRAFVTDIYLARAKAQK